MWWPEFFLQPRKCDRQFLLFVPIFDVRTLWPKAWNNCHYCRLLFTYGNIQLCSIWKYVFQCKILMVFWPFFFSVKNRHPFFSILILSSLSLHLWFFMSTTWQNITFPSRKMLLSSWVFEVTHICSKIEGGGCWLPPFLGNSNHFPLFFHLYPLFQFSSSIHIYWSDLTIRNCGIYHVHYLSPGFQSYSIKRIQI